MEWVGVWHAWEREINVYKVLVGNLQERDHFEDLGVGWGIILKRTLKKYGCDGVECIYVAEDRDR
jgi:hypothetical protein